VKLAWQANFFWLMLVRGWCITFALTFSAIAGDVTLPPLPVDLPVTNGLIRWWPNPFDARDEITGQEGVVMGVLPALANGAEDRTPFTYENGWVQLQPAVTNEVFTCAFWINLVAGASGAIWQQSRDTCWFLEINGRSLTEFVLRVGDGKRESELKETVPLPGSEWHHVAVARKQDDTSTIWLDGRRAMDGRTPFAWPRDSRWLILGGRPGGGQMVMQLRDICFFNRTLDDEEVGRLSASGLKERLSRNTAARRAATEVSFPVTLSTNVADAPPSLWNHRRLTAEDNLPDNTVSALLQDQKGYLWVGTPEWHCSLRWTQVPKFYLRKYTCARRDWPEHLLSGRRHGRRHLGWHVRRLGAHPR
jgi:hypothetical protein